MQIFSELSTYISQKIASQKRAYIVLEAVIAVILIFFLASKGCTQFRDIEKEQSARQLTADNSFEESY